MADSDSSTIDQLFEGLIGLSPDVLEAVLDALTGIDLSALSHDDVINIVGAGVTGVAGAASRHYLDHHRAELETAIRRALAAI